MGNQHATACLVGRQPMNRLPIQDVRYLALGIGSIRGVALLSAYKRLVQKGLPRLQGIAGSSVGCILGLGIVLQMSTNELQQFLEHFIEQQGSHFTIKIERSCGKFSWINNEPLRVEIERLLRERNMSPTITFLELYQKTKVDYRVVAYNLETKTTETFNYQRTPTDSVIHAIMASSSIPYLFKPERLRDQCYIDGGFVNEIPLREFPLSQTLGLYLYDAYRDRTNADKLFSSLSSTEKDHFISMDVSRVKTTHFKLTTAMKAYLTKQGEDSIDIYYPPGLYPLKQTIR